MSNHKVFYAEEVKQLNQRVDKCSFDVLDSIEFFLEEANNQMSGIDHNITDEINKEIKRFKNNCSCKKK